MDKNIEEHFNRFYHNLLFSTEIGKKEKEYESNLGYNVQKENGIFVVSTFYEQKVTDKFVLFKVDGIILRFNYGEWYNEKHENLDIYIYPDQYYDGKKQSIKDVLKLLNDYMENNYREYNKRIDKIIYGLDNAKNIKIKTKKDNLFNIDFIKSATIKDLDITDEDIKMLSKYKNLKQLTTRRCNYRIKDLSGLDLMTLMDIDSSISSMNVFSNINIRSLFLNNTQILDKTIKNGTFKIGNLNLENIEINYEMFFLLTNFTCLKELYIDGITLNNNEMNLLRVFYKMTELATDGKTESLDFLKHLNELEQLRVNIEITNSNNYQLLCNKHKKILDKYNESYDNDLSNYFIHLELSNLIKNKKFFDKIRVSKVALSKLQGIFGNSTEEDVVNNIKYYSNLPYSIKTELFKKDDLVFIDTDLSQVYKLFGIEIPKNNFYETNIIGPDGYKLCVDRRGEIPIFNSKGNILEVVEYQNERDIIIPEYIEKNVINIVSNSDNIFDYYYNHKLNNIDKYNYLKKVIENDEIFISNEKYVNINKHNNELNSLLEELEKELNKIYLNLWVILIHVPTHDYRLEEEIFHGKKCHVEIEIEDPYIDKNDEIIHDILKRHRNIKSIERLLNRYFKEDNICKEQQEIYISNIQGYIDLLNKKDVIKSELIDYVEILENNVDDKYRNIVDCLNNCDYRIWYINDIEKFLNNFNLNDHERGIFIKYVLLKQSYLLSNLDAEKSEISNSIFKMDERSEFSYDYIQNWLDCEDYKEAYELGKISKEKFDLWVEYENKCGRLSELSKLLDVDTATREKEYIKMMPLIDKLSNEQLVNIKDNIYITNERNKFDKFVDYLYYYFYNDYPYWIKKELLMCPELPKKYESSVGINKIEERKVHQCSHRKIKNGLF